MVKKVYLHGKLVELCERPLAPQKADPCTSVIFGDACLPAMSDEACRGFMAEACRGRLGRDCPAGRWERFSALLNYQGGALDDASTFRSCRAGTWGPAAADELLGREGRRWLTK